MYLKQHLIYPERQKHDETCFMAVFIRKSVLLTKYKCFMFVERHRSAVQLGLMAVIKNVRGLEANF